LESVLYEFNEGFNVSRWGSLWALDEEGGGDAVQSKLGCNA